MRTYDVVIVGGGPAGGACARALELAGAHAVLLERERLPREKPCAGWVTPAVFDALGLAPADYARNGRTLQPFTAFAVSVMDGPTVQTNFPDVVSYGIRRSEFDAMILRTLRTPVLEATPLVALRRQGGQWILNDSIAAPIVVGAGGHFCPVARQVARAASRHAVLARGIELRLDPGEQCAVEGPVPELFFCRDLEGYGWCIRKGEYLNVGIGRRRGEGFRSHVAAFASFLRESGRVPSRVTDWRHWRGHAYTLAGDGTCAIGDGVVLIGDAAGLAARESGEGIAPAIESALAATSTIVGAAGDYSRENLQPYADWVSNRAPGRSVGGSLRAHVPAVVGRTLLYSPAFARMVVEHWFLRSPAPHVSA
jgi:flavin-dependent dehydrogenase